jgi:hypothetical protein
MQEHKEQALLRTKNDSPGCNGYTHLLAELKHLVKLKIKKQVPWLATA